MIAALDAAVEAGRTSYVFKTYGKAPLPASGFQESDIGHNVQFSAGRAVADDIDSWVTTGMPMRDLPYADPADLSTIRIDRDAAQIIQGPR